MRKPRFWTLLICVLSALIISIIGYSSWLIVTRQNTNAVTTDVIAECECQSFITSLTYEDADLSSNKNGYGRLALTDAGKSIFGASSNTDLSKFTITLLDGESGESNNSKFFDGRKRADVANDNTWLSAAGIFAGEYHYKIVETATGQLVCADHVLTISRREVELKTTAGSPTFIGKEMKWTGVSILIKGTTTAAGTIDLVLPTEFKKTAEPSHFGTDGVYTAIKYVGSGNVPYTHTFTGSTGFFNNNMLDGVTKSESKYVLNINLSYTLYGTTTIGSNYYADLNTALAKASSNTTGETITALHSFTDGATTYNALTHYSHVISSDATIKSGDTLLIPYDAAGNVINRVGGHSSGNGISASDAVNKLSNEANNFDKKVADGGEKNGTYEPTLTNKVVLASDVTLTVEGTLTIGGVLGINGQGYSLTSDGKAYGTKPVTTTGPAGVTSGKFAKLEMQEGSSVSIGGTLNAYGYITEVTNNTTTVTATATATIYMPFVIYDYGGGSATVGLYDPGGSTPFNIFDMPNIQSELTCKHGAKIIGLASLFTGYKSINLYITTYESWPSYNATEMTILAPADSNTSKNDEALFIMDSGEAVFNYDAAGTYQANFADGGNCRPDKKAKTDITLRGKVTSGALKMHITIVEGLVEKDVDLATVFFPVSYKMNLSLTGSYSYTFTSDFKFLPGSRLNVGDSASLTVNSGSSLIFYDNFTDGTTDYATSITEIKNYYPTDFRNVPAELSVSGSVTVRGDLAGLITPTAAGATINFTGATGTTLSITEGNGGFEGTSGKFTAIYTETQNAHGAVANNGTVADGTLVKKTYTAVEKDGKIGWKYVLDNITITYNANGGTTPSNKTDSGVYSDVGVTLTGSAYLPTTTRTYYTFSGWYLDSAFTKPADGATIYASTTLYAKWTPTTYTTDFRYVGLDGVDEADRPALPTNVEFNVEGEVTLPNTPESELTFNGWYFDEACTNRVTTAAISGSDLLGNNRVLYGKWVSVQYTITFEDDKYGDVTYQNDTIAFTEEQLADATLPTVKDYMRDISKQYYFLGWYLGDTLVTDYSFIDVNDTDNTAYTLTPKWAQKYELIINNVSSGGNTAITFNEHIYLYDDTQIAEHFTTYDTKAKQYDGDTKVNKYFTGWSNGTSTVTSLTTASFNATTKSLTLIPSWASKLYIKYSANKTSVYTDLVTYGTNVYYRPGTVVTLPAITGFDNVWTRQYYLESWKANDTALSLTATSYTLNANTEIAITWGTKTEITVSNSSSTITITHISNNNATYTTGGYAKVGDTIKASVSYDKSDDRTFTKDGESYTGANVTVGTSKIAFAASSSSCVAAGTLITLADGTQKKVEDLLETDILLVFDHETGKFVEAGIIFIEDDGYDYYNVINLKFSDGTITRLIYEHALFDATLNKYVYIREDNYSDYVGHEFVIVNNGVMETVTLDEAYVTYEYTGCYSLVTAYHLNYFIDGLMSIPGGIEGLFNIFEYGEGYKYDEQKMQEDIEKYGLYTYEDFEEYIPVEIFEIFQAQYLKISVEKGYITFDEILALIERYIVGHGFV